MSRYTYIDENNIAHLIKTDLNDPCEYCFYAIQKLAIYENLKEQNRLILLPCAFGTDVYGIYADDCGNTNCLLNCDNCEKSYWRIYKTIFEPININNFGKTIFLTKEEAEAKLKEIKGE